MANIVIIGAGLTGLSAAYHLEQLGINDYKIYEKNTRSGGLLRSFKQDGFTFDFTGHLLHISDEYFRKFLNDILGLESLLYVCRRSAIHTHNTLLAYPFQMNLHGLPTDVIYECIQGFLKRKTALRKPQSFYDWVLKYFGSGIGKHFFYPYNSKLLSYNLKSVHPSWTGRFVPQTNLKAIISGALTSEKNRHVGYNSYFYYPKFDGIEYIIKKIAATVKQPINLEHEVVHINPDTKELTFANGNKEKYKHLISTLPLNQLLEKTHWGNHLSLKQVGKKLLCNTVLNFNVGFNVNKISNHHWLYFPEKKYLFYRLGFWHNICKSSAPAGTSAIYGELSFLPGTKTKQQQTAMVNKALEQALDFLQLNTSNILTIKKLILQHAYVIYDQYREKNLPKILHRLKEYNIQSTGRFGEWKYSSMQEAVLDGKKAAENAAKQQRIIQPSTVIQPTRKNNNKQVVV